MLRHFFYILFIWLVAGATDVSAQIFTPRHPIYIVNGERMQEAEVKAIDPEDIVENKLLPADEETIAKYGQEASNGVMLITLRYDTPALFTVDGQEQNFSSYVADQVEWKYPNPAARVIISFKVNPDGSTAVNKVLEATDKRFLRRVEKALAAAPKWSPALKDGKPITTQHVLRITIPKGATVQREKIVISRW